MIPSFCIKRFFVLMISFSALSSFPQEPKTARIYVQKEKVDSLRLYAIDVDFIINNKIEFIGFEKLRDLFREFRKAQFNDSKYKIMTPKDTVVFDEYLTHVRPSLGLICVELNRDRRRQYIYLYVDEFLYEERNSRSDFFNIAFLEFTVSDGTYFFDFYKPSEKNESFPNEIYQDGVLFPIGSQELLNNKVSDEPIPPDEMFKKLNKRKKEKSIRKIYKEFERYKT